MPNITNMPAVPPGGADFVYSLNPDGSLNVSYTPIPAAPFVVKQSGVAASVTGTLTETVLASITIPANSMGPNGTVRITATWSMTNNANAKVMVTKFGGTAINTSTATTSSTYREMRSVTNRGSLTSQTVFPGVFGGFGLSGAAMTTLTKDTAVAQVVQLTGTLANVADTLTLESYLVEVLPG